MDIALVLPTIREQHCREFLKAWDFGLQGVQVFVIEDNPTLTFDLSNYPDVAHYAWDSIKQVLGPHEWIIPRRTAAIRSFGYLIAYREGADVILTLDDDCLPMPNAPDERRLFAGDHIAALARTYPRWVDTIECHALRARGIPYSHEGISSPTMINMGGWANVPDIDAPTTLVSWHPNKHYEMKQWDPVPMGSYLPLCAMNVGFDRDATVLMYQLLMSQDHEGNDWPFIRFDDIWGGVIAKKLCDSLGLAITAGKPVVWHDRASNVWTNLRNESKGMEVNEGFWIVVDAVRIDATEPIPAYYELAVKLETALKKVYPDHKGYWNSLCTAMRIWAEEVGTSG